MRRDMCSGMYKVETNIMEGESVESAVERCKERLKERLWHDVWKECVDLPDVRVMVKGNVVSVEI